MTSPIFIVAIIICEIILSFLFSVIAQIFYQKNGIDFSSLFKGIVERSFLFVSLINDFPHSLTLFGALKVATRLKHTSQNSTEEEAYNNFYLLGNFLSATIAIGYVYFYKKYFTI